ncbi:DUF5107 domain-containing protein [Marinitoga sp. 38H-ov]|uniref:DUF5107 domain-containing protein n=1 Tax=Marinitoga sp. 38H-ov TaxID=1755814 RepID=UPI0013EBB0E8|nr:DUF5107 domain-containing protein [Marinitoga sp. 38H-ov]KAF2956695.1 hypothetical protein AS160_04760 [Marinitoga sp. 38H-ov]
MKYYNMESIILENNNIKLVVIPQIGAKVASIIYKPQNFEVLFQPTLKKYRLPKYGDSFEKYDTSGIDEMFPNIDECIYPFEEYYGEKLPDHGELWSIPWLCKKINDTSIYCEVKSPKFNYIFKRTINLKNNTIVFNYSVKNLNKTEFRGFWAFHGLIAIDNNSEIILENIDKVLNVKKNSKFLGNFENICDYPIYNNYNLNKFLPIESKNTEKFYLLDKINSAGITLNNNKLLYNIEFKDLPYAGIWKNEGGFKGEYNCAIEPCNGFYDSLEIAKKYNKYLIFEPGEEKSWKISIELKENSL